MTYGAEDVARALGMLVRGTASFDVRASLEHHLLMVLTSEGPEGLSSLLSSLPEHEFGPGVSGSVLEELAFRSPASGYPRLVVETFLTREVASVNVSFEEREEGREDPDPRHQAFYDTWEGFLVQEETPVESLSPWPKAVFLIGLLESQVMNGGLGQYLTNTDGAFLEETLSCLEKIGANRTASILRMAERLGSEAQSFVAAWESNSAAFEDLDEQFLASGEDLAGLTADGFPGSIPTDRSS